MARNSRLSVCLAMVMQGKFLKDPLRQIDQPPAHNAVDRRERTILNHLRDNLALGITLSFGGWPGDLPSSSPFRTRDALNRNTQSRMI